MLIGPGKLLRAITSRLRQRAEPGKGEVRGKEFYKCIHIQRAFIYIYVYIYVYMYAYIHV